MAVLGSFIATSLVGQRGHFSELTPMARVTAVVYSLWFYPWKTLAPTSLSPLYELPARLDPTEPRFVVAAAGTLALAALVLALARRWPAVLAAAAAYVILIAPVSGIRHTGPQLVADRYSYLSSMPIALLLAGVVCMGVEAYHRGVMPPSRARLAAGALVVWLAALGVLAAYQSTIWRDGETLWRRAVAHDPGCFICQHNLGGALLGAGRTADAIEAFRRAVALRPSSAVAHASLAMAYARSGALEEARAHIAIVRESDPDLARVLAAQFVTEW
jgi:tetratricopeptide (TPR) repeat protein